MATKKTTTPGGRPAVNARVRPKHAPAVRATPGHTAQLSRFGEGADLLPAPTSEEIAFDRDIAARLNAATDMLRALNLANAVALAQQAARGEGRLIEVFNELGRRFSSHLSQPAPRRSFRVIEGGAK